MKQRLKIEEVWVTFDVLPNYAVSNYGRVTNVRFGRDLKPFPDTHGYMQVALYHNGSRRAVYVHRLVARAFFLNYEDGIEVKHINENKEDNTVLNLELGERACRVGELVW